MFRLKYKKKKKRKKKPVLQYPHMLIKSLALTVICYVSQIKQSLKKQLARQKYDRGTVTALKKHYSELGWSPRFEVLCSEVTSQVRKRNNRNSRGQ